MKKIQLTQGYTALVDDGDFVFLNQFKWHVMITSRCAYAMTKIKGQHVLMHLLLLNFPKGREVDHRNSNGTDNQRHNLRIATRVQNAQNRRLNKDNTSGYKGVYINSGRGRKYRAQINSDGIKYNLGYFDTAIEAARVYNDAARKLHKDFASLNVI